MLRLVAYLAVAAALIAPVAQFQYQTSRNLRKAELSRAEAARRNIESPGKTHKGAIGRWRFAVRELWDGQNIYRPDGPGKAKLHPNMPFTVMLLTPFAYLPVWAMALSFNVLKLLVLGATILMAARIAGDGGRRIADWVVMLALLWSLLLIVGDIQHGNTNVFVLGAIVLHLWLYRRGRDLAAGASLALAICLKMTPALFVLYWLYQRNWRLLAGTVAALLLFGVVVPAAALGPAHYATLTGTWLEYLIIPGLVKGAWYPIHINQSLPGVVSRYVLGGANGDIFWNPDDYPVYAQNPHEGYWIHLVVLSESAAKTLVRVGQVVVVGLMAWAIGWRKLARTDGRRGLHYGLVALGMLLLNQRTWDHHAGVTLVATVAIWQALGFGRISARARRGAFVLMIAGGLALWFSRSDMVRVMARVAGQPDRAAKVTADIVTAYGPAFFCFLAMLVAGVILAVALKKPDPPYAERRQKL